MTSVLVTGANRGIGLGLTRHLLAEPSVGIVIATARDVESAKELKDLNKAKLRIVQLEVVNEDSISKAAKEVAKIVGDAGLDILINNAGIGYPVLLNGFLSKAEIIEQFEVNTIAPLLIANMFYPLLKLAAAKKGSAQIANISSTLGSLDFAPNMPNDKHLSIYAMTKVFLKNALEAILIPVRAQHAYSSAVEWKDDKIRATSFCPGFVRTDKGGQNAFLSVDESTIPLSKLILSLTEAHNGNYYKHSGEVIAW